MAGAVVGRRMDAPLHGRGADAAAQSAAGRSGFTSAPSRRDRVHDRDRAARRSGRAGSVLLRRSSFRTCSSSSWPMWARRRSTSWARKSAARASWAAIGSWNGSDRAAWARSGAPSIVCSLGQPRSSSSGPRSCWGHPACPRTRMRRFEREAQVTAAPSSPHTVELFDFGIADDGGFYYVMELLDGLDLDALVRRTDLSRPSASIHLLRQVCHSLSEAESCGLVHRDIKPANIFVCRYGEEYDFVKVLDFGIVKAARATLRRRNLAITQDMAVHGTPAFIAPEQASVAPIWTVAPTSMPPAASPTGCSRDNSCSRARRRWACCCTTRTRRRRRRPRDRVADSPALDELVLSCLAKNPAERPQSARELSRRLASRRARPWNDDRARAWWDTHQPESSDAARESAFHVT